MAGISAFVLQPVPVLVTEGSVARFSCVVASSPPAAITWELNQSALALHTDRCVRRPRWDALTVPAALKPHVVSSTLSG